MPTTRYGVRVQPNEQKKYSVSMSAAPILSHQKRYGVQLENRLVQFRQYPLTLQPYSRRSAVSMTPVRAKRREREFDASLLNPLATDIQNRTYQTQLIDAQESHSRLIEDAVGLRDLEPALKVTALTAGNLTQENTVRIDERPAQFDDVIKSSRIGRIIHTEITVPENMERVSEESTVLHEIDATMMTSNTVDAEALQGESGFRYSIVEPSAYDDLEAATYINLDHETVLVDLPSGTVTRKTLDAIETEMVGADSPYMETYEHIIYSGARIQVIRDTDQLSPVQVERLNTSDAMLDLMERGNESSRITAAYFDELASYQLLGRTYSGMERVLEAAKANVVIETAISNELIPASSESRETEATFTNIEQTERQVRTFDASQQEIKQAFNDGQIIPAIVTPGMGATPGPTATTDALLDVQERTERTIREMMTVHSGIDQAENGVVIHEVNMQPLDHAAVGESSTRDIVLSEQSASAKIQEPQSAHIVGMETIEQIANTILADQTELVSVSGQPNQYDAYLHTMEMSEAIGMLVDEAKFDAVTRIRVERLADFSDASKGFITNNVILATIDGQESGTRTNYIKPAALTDFLTSRVALRTFEAHAQDQEQTINKRLPEEAELIVLQHATNPMKLIEAITVDTDKAYRADSWLDGVVHVSTQATTSREYGEALLTLPGRAEKIMTDSEVVFAEVDAGERQTTSLASLDAGDHAVKVSVYAAHLESTHAADSHASEDVSVLAELTQAWAHAGRIGQAVLMDGIDQATTTIGEYEVYESDYDAAESAGMPSLEHRIEAAERKVLMHATVLTNPDKGKTSNRFSEAIVSHAAETKLASGIVDAIQDDTERVSRSDIETDAIFTDTMPAIYANNDEIVYIDSFEHGTRINIEPAFRSDELYQAERLKENDAILSSDSMKAERQREKDTILIAFENTDRMKENDAVLSGDPEHAERISIKPTLLDDVEATERIAIVDAWLTFSEASERRYLEETQFILWETAERIMTDVVQMEETTRAERIAVSYTELADFTRGKRTLKSGILVDAETAKRYDIEPAILESYEPGELVTKKKKKIWLIPGRGNHWNNWSGWKKTR